jgi:hypothetical protein
MNLPLDSRFSSAVKRHLWRFLYLKTFLTHLLGSPVKEASLEALSLSLFRVRCSIPRVPLILLSKSPVDKPSNRFSMGPLLGRDAYLQSLIYLSTRVPSKGALLPGSCHRESK